LLKCRRWLMAGDEKRRAKNHRAPCRGVGVATTRTGVPPPPPPPGWWEVRGGVLFCIAPGQYTDK
jgi:hypothetical protein